MCKLAPTATELVVDLEFFLNHGFGQFDRAVRSIAATIAATNAGVFSEDEAGLHLSYRATVTAKAFCVYSQLFF